MHPPGYPLYCILGGLFVHMIPFGEPAYRLGLLSAVCASAATALCYLLGRRLGGGWRWSISGALIFAFSIALWQQATKVETYALNALFVAALLYLASDYERTGVRNRLYRIALVGGLALTNHLTIFWLIPAILAIVLPKLIQTEGRLGAWKALAATAGVCLLPLGLYGYEIYAAWSHPGGQIWGDPSTLQRLLLHVTGARYHGLLNCRH